ncbi:MAG: hypothetical protein AVDCRST_MAG06-1763, partial [uncultured Nocardioides sp.]
DGGLGSPDIRGSPRFVPVATGTNREAPVPSSPGTAGSTLPRLVCRVWLPRRGGAL